MSMDSSKPLFFYFVFATQNVSESQQFFFLFIKLPILIRSQGKIFDACRISATRISASKRLTVRVNKKYFLL
jgi:hypothetical protein